MFSALFVEEINFANGTKHLRESSSFTLFAPFNHSYLAVLTVDHINSAYLLINKNY